VSFVLGEEILVDFLELDGPVRAYTHSIFNHEGGDQLSVNKNNTLWEMTDEFASMATKA
jgi:hypothetical protein